MPYLIFSKGLDYNDEYYSVGGEDSYVEKNGFLSLEAAKAAVREKYIDMMKPNISTSSYSKGADWSHRVGEFGEGDEPAWALVEELGYEDVDSWQGPHYHEIMAKADEAGIDWLRYMPQLYEVVEVTFDD